MASSARKGPHRPPPVVLAIAALGLLCGPATAQTERRLALVVGNDRYADAPLTNAVNDAKAVAAALTRTGFSVTPVYDGNRQSLERALATFEGQIRSDDVAIFYYAGHGVQVDGENFLIPIDFSGRGNASVRLGTVRLSDVQTSLKTARVRVFILDACRTNPFSGMRSYEGLAPMEARGSLIAMAAAAGKPASDQPTGANGLYTSQLLKFLDEPGLSLRDIFFRVRQQVYYASEGKQFPEVYDQLLGDIVLRPQSNSPTVDRAIPTPAPPQAERIVEAAKPPVGYTPANRSSPIRGLSAADYAAVLARPEARSAARDGTKSEVADIIKLVDRAIVERKPAINELSWRYFVLKAQGGKEYVPFTVFVPTAAAVPGVSLFYWRVIQRGRPASGQKTYEYEDVSTLQIDTTPFRVSRSFTVPSGEYDVYVAVKNPASPASAAVYHDSVSIPDFWNGQLSASSLMVNSRIDQLPSPVTPTVQQSRPYALGSMELIPLFDVNLSKRSELSTFLLIYNPTLAPTGKPDVRVEYNFYQKIVGQTEKFFNKTNPQLLNTQTLPSSFDLAAGHQLQSGQAVGLASFPDGDYRLEIKVTDNVSNRSVVRDLNFTVQP